jgi:hypothetical protein
MIFAKILHNEHIYARPGGFLKSVKLSHFPFVSLEKRDVISVSRPPSHEISMWQRGNLLNR